MQTRRLIIGYIFYICISAWIVYIYGFSSLSNLWTPLLGYYVITYFIHAIWSKIRGKIIMDFFGFFILFLYKTAVYFSLLVIVIGGFLYYQNNILPAKLPVYTISNGDKTIVFQTMSHIGSESFYNSVVNNIYHNKKSGAVLYYEGVGVGSEENNQDFNKALGIDFAPGLYDNFSKLYGVTAQDNNDFLGLVNNLDYNIDLNLDQVMSLYREKVGTGSIESGGVLANDSVHTLNDEVIQQLIALSPRELLVLRYINQGILNFMIKHEGLREFLISKLANRDIFSVILDDRNKHIVQEVLTREDEKIIILYGLMHFKGVLELLQSQDSSWKIVDTQYLQIITQSS